MDQQQIIDLGVRLFEVAAKNTSSMIAEKIRVSKTKKVDKETISQLEDIIFELIEEKNEALQIAQAYRDVLVVQRISDEDLNYITQSLIPKVRELAQAIGKENEVNKILDVFVPLVSKETLTILQLLGFNFKQAIGEPLTQLLQNKILQNTSNREEALKREHEMSLEIVKLLHTPQGEKKIQLLQNMLKK